MARLLVAREVDRRLGYPRGRSAKLAKAGKIPHVTLPDGEIRFIETEIDEWLRSLSTARPADKVGA